MAHVMKPLAWATGAALFFLRTPCSSAAIAPSVKLNNGVEMPLLSFGANLYPRPTCLQATTWAIEAGFRFIWSSEIIGEDCQSAQRQAIEASGVPRAELFIAGTVNTQSCAGLDDCYQKTKAGSERQFAVLGATKLDMLMLDYPASSGCDGIKGQWKAFEEIYSAQRVRTIAVSNFEEAQLQCVVSTPGATVPSVNQVEYNVGLGHLQGLTSMNRKFGVLMQAYSPLGSGGLLHDPLLVQIGKQHGKSAAQVALRWLLHQGVAANLASTKLEHLREDVDVFDFDLDANEVSQLGVHFKAADASS